MCNAHDSYEYECVKHVCCYLFNAVELILDQYRARFISEVDANAIVYELQHKGIISDGDLAMISRSLGMTLQNGVLHSCLKNKCTVEALMEVCDMIIAVKGNPKMKRLGEDMKNKLAGKYCVCVSSVILILLDDSSTLCEVCMCIGVCVRSVCDVW